MWFPAPIRVSNFNKYIINRFDLIYDIASKMRGNHYFYVSAERGAIYGVQEDAVMIREVKLPPYLQQQKSFMFRLDMVNKDMVAKYINFVLYPEIQWAIFPLDISNDYNEYIVEYSPVDENHVWCILLPNKEVAEYVELISPDASKLSTMRSANLVMSSFLSSRGYLDRNHYIFPNMNLYMPIQKVFGSKASMGEKLIKLTYDGRDYSFFLCKGLFSFNKNDGLVITATDRLDNPSLFELSFTVTHDKNPIKYIIDGDFVEKTYATFLHLK